MLAATGEVVDCGGSAWFGTGCRVDSSIAAGPQQAFSATGSGGVKIGEDELGDPEKERIRSWDMARRHLRRMRASLTTKDTAQQPSEFNKR
jgi:hypothetical protein